MPRPKKGQEHPRPEVAQQIGLLVAIGTPHAQIAKMLGMGTDTMHRHYKDDLELGSAKAGAVVGGKIFEAAKRGEQWACTLWAARRMGWKETNVTETRAASAEELSEDDLANIACSGGTGDSEQTPSAPGSDQLH
jgi:hypothetical protein